MDSFLKVCVQYFGTHNFYEILKIEKTATEKEIKKAYHKLSRFVHPDKVDEDKKLEATEKFKILGKVHSILSNTNKKKVYDKFGTFENDFSISNWKSYWSTIFKNIEIEDIIQYEKDYIGSETEINDIKRAYMNGKGSMDCLFEQVPFSKCEHEPRYLEIIKKLIENNEVPEYKCFTNEPEERKEQRRLKFEREKAKVEGNQCFEKMRKNMVRRQHDSVNFILDLEAKYCLDLQNKRKDKNNESSEVLAAKRVRK